MEVVKLLVLDIDGTVRESKSGAKFIQGIEDIKIIDGVKEKLEWFKEQDYQIVGCSNQAGIAHGFKTSDHVDLEFDQTSLLLDHLIEDIFYAPSDHKGKVFPYNYRSLLRKPEIGMLVEMEITFFDLYKLVVDWDNSIFIGDRPEDEECARRAGVKFIPAEVFHNQSIDDISTYFYDLSKL